MSDPEAGKFYQRRVPQAARAGNDGAAVAGLSRRRRVKFLFDMGVGIAAETWIRTRGYDIATVRDLDPSMADSRILDLAAAEERLVVTMDKDFGELVFRSGRMLLQRSACTSSTTRNMNSFKYIIKYG